MGELMINPEIYKSKAKKRLKNSANKWGFSQKHHGFGV
jgi:hypothetical protein